MYTNRLINSRDPYLLLHAHNPVDWYPWGSRGARQGKTGEQADLSLDRVQHLLLVSRRRAHDLFGSGDRHVDEPVVHQHQG